MKRCKSRKNHPPHWAIVPTGGEETETRDGCLQRFAYLGPIAPDAMIRDKDLKDVVAGRNVAKGAKIMGYLTPNWDRHRMVIYEGIDVTRFRRAVLDHKFDLGLICLAARLGRAPTRSEIALMKAKEAKARKEKKRSGAAGRKRVQEAA